MGFADVGLFKAAEARLAWAGQRQQVLAQNVANSSTPGYQPRDIAPFENFLSAASSSAASSGASLSRTAPQHLQASGAGLSVQNTRSRERAPDGNSVSLEDQLTKVADTANTQELVTNLYRKYQSMFRVALGRGGA